MEDKLSDIKLSPLIPKTPEATKYHQDVFVPHIYEKLQTRIKEIQLSILICGPKLYGDNNPLANKRKNTINQLRLESFDAYTGEEIEQELSEYDAKDNQPRKPAHIYEMIAARNSDLVVIFRASYGSVAELHDFLADREIAQRLWLFVDKAHKSGYSSNGRVVTYENTQRPVIYYDNPEDIEKCTLLTRVLDIANNHRVAKFAQINGL